MKLIVLSALLLPAVLMAQALQPALPGGRRVVMPQGSGAQQSSELLPDNYQITLNITDKDGAPLELSVVVASTQFTAMFGEQSLVFGGNVKVEEAGGNCDRLRSGLADARRRSRHHAVCVIQDAGQRAAQAG